MKKKIDKKKKEYLFCLGCGTRFVKTHPSFNECPVCLCCHSVHRSSMRKPYTNIWYIGVVKLDEVVRNKYSWWKSYEVSDLVKPDKVMKKILRQVNEKC